MRNGDLNGTLGALCGDEPQRVADYIIRLEAAAGPHALTIESPMLGENREAVIGRLSALVAALEARASSVRIAADEFCNSLSDIEAFADRRAAHLIQIKMPDLGASTGRSRRSGHATNAGCLRSWVARATRPTGAPG